MQNDSEKPAFGRTIELAHPAALGMPERKFSPNVRKALVLVATHRCCDMADFKILLSRANKTLNRQKGATVKFGHEKFDTYDEYFSVDRVQGCPVDLLARATIKTLYHAAFDARKGHDLDPFAVSAWLNSVRVQASIILERVDAN